jgi:hypothetical protein
MCTQKILDRSIAARFARPIDQGPYQFGEGLRLDSIDTSINFEPRGWCKKSPLSVPLLLKTKGKRQLFPQRLGP